MCCVQSHFSGIDGKKRRNNENQFDNIVSELVDSKKIASLLGWNNRARSHNLWLGNKNETLHAQTLEVYGARDGNCKKTSVLVLHPSSEQHTIRRQITNWLVASSIAKEKQMIMRPMPKKTIAKLLKSVHKKRIWWEAYKALTKVYRVYESRIAEKKWGNGATYVIARATITATPAITKSNKTNQKKRINVFISLYTLASFIIFFFFLAYIPSPTQTYYVLRQLEANSRASAKKLQHLSDSFIFVSIDRNTSEFCAIPFAWKVLVLPALQLYLNMKLLLFAYRMFNSSASVVWHNSCHSCWLFVFHPPRSYLDAHLPYYQ